MKTQKSHIGILGYGEVGKAIARFYKKPLIREIDKNEFRVPLEVLHVCIPDSKNFSKIVSENIKTYHPRLVIIHSTATPGTTKKLYQKFKNVVHSPIRGIHPFLYEGVKTFVKYIGCDNRALGEMVSRHFQKIGIQKVKVISPSISTELAKLFDTTYYGLAIAFHSYAAKICQKTGVDFDEVMTDFNKTYNAGYKALGKTNVIRPVLYPPKEDVIGGHCVIPNAEILKRNFGGDEILESILRHKSVSLRAKRSNLFKR